METRWCCIAIVRNDNILGCLFAEYSCYYYGYGRMESLLGTWISSTRTKPQKDRQRSVRNLVDRIPVL